VLSGSYRFGKKTLKSEKFFSRSDLVKQEDGGVVGERCGRAGLGSMSQGGVFRDFRIQRGKEISCLAQRHFIVETNVASTDSFCRLKPLFPETRGDKRRLTCIVLPMRLCQGAGRANKASEV